ncbi:MAG: nucleotidyltransferase domain-containing protein [Bacteroidetes bacterium]|nr:nucleotidyltransferase domain-containing protein [Bacteroidota bacterium]
MVKLTANLSHRLFGVGSIFKQISKSIHENDPNAEAFLFGSRARGDHKKNSDCDILILVESNEVTNDIEDMFREELYNIELETGQIISTFIYPKNYWNNSLVYSPLYKKIKMEGVRL